MSLAASIRAMYAAKNEAVCLAYLLRLPESSGREDRAKEIARAGYPTLREAVDELRRSAKTSATVAHPAHGSNRFEREGREIEGAETPSMISINEAADLMGVARGTVVSAKTVVPAPATATKAAAAPPAPPTPSLTVTTRDAAPEPSTARGQVPPARTSDAAAAGLETAVQRMVAQRGGNPGAIEPAENAAANTGLDQAVASLVRSRTRTRATVALPVDATDASDGLTAACAGLAAGRTGGRAPDRASNTQRARDMRSGIDIAREHLAQGRSA